MTVYRNAGQWDASNVQFEARQIVGYDKNAPTAEMQFIDYGLGILHRGALNHWSETERFDLADVYKRLLSENQLAGCEVKERFYEIGSPQGLAELDALLGNAKVS